MNSVAFFPLSVKLGRVVNQGHLIPLLSDIYYARRTADGLVRIIDQCYLRTRSNPMVNKERLSLIDSGKWNRNYIKISTVLKW